MALAFQLQQAGFAAEELRTVANLTMTQQGGGFAITAIRLDLTARVPGIDEARFRELADEAKANCPVSKVLRAEITLDATLQAGAAAGAA
jgi:osmotically inducible protein OsmC